MTASTARCSHCLGGEQRNLSLLGDTELQALRRPAGSGADVRKVARYRDVPADAMRHGACQNEVYDK